MIWKVLAAVGGICTLGLGALLYRILSDFGDGMASAFGYPRPKRWRRG